MSDSSVPLEALLTHHAWVRRVARAIAGNDADGDDLAQDVWLRALESRPREEKSVRRWFRTVLTRAHSDRRRGEGRRVARDTTAGVPAAEESAADLVAEADAHRRVVDAVMDLAEPYRTTVLLRFFRDLPVAEVARREGVPLETVRTRLRRALALLRERYVRDGRDERAWALLPLLRFEDSVVPGSSAALGVLVMAMKTKVAVAAVLIALAGTAWWGATASWDTRPVPSVTAGTEAGTTDPVVRSPTVPLPQRARAGQTDVAGATAVPASGPLVAHGVVLDDDTGLPVAGAVVRAGNEFVRKLETEPRATSGADGAFRIPGDNRGVDALFVEAPGYAALVLPVPWRDGRSGLASGEAGEIRLFRGRRISGRVLDAAGAGPVPHARIHLSATGASTAALWVNYAAAWGTADASGNFALEGVPPSHRFPYTLFATSPQGMGWTKLAPVAGRQILEGVEVRLAPQVAASVSVVDEEKRPVVGATVLVSPRFEPLGPPDDWGDDHQCSPPRDSGFAALLVSTTGTDGIARFPHLPGGGVFDFIARSARGAAWKDRIALQSGRDTVVEIVLARTAMWEVRGTVRTPEGAGVPGAVLRHWSDSAGIRSDEEGRYRLEGLDPTAREVGFSVDADGFAKTHVRVKYDAKQRVVERDVVVQRAAPIAGVVVDQHGKPVAGIHLRLEREGEVTDESVTTAEDGTFAMPDATQGAWTLRISPPQPYDAWLWPDETPVAQGGDRAVRVVLPRAVPGRARLVADVVDETTGDRLLPLEAQLIRTTRGPFGPASHGRLDLSSGRVVIERVKPGSWILCVRVGGRAPSITRIEVDQDQTEVALRVAVGGSGTLRGRIEMPVGATPGSGMVVIRVADAESVPSWAEYRTEKMIGAAGLESDGTFVFRDLMPGRHRFILYMEGWVGETVADVESGRDTTAAIAATRAAGIRFQFAEPAPSGAVSVEITREGGPWIHLGHVGATRHPLAPGRVRWRAKFPGGAMVEGEVDCVAGETSEVTVPAASK